jgi:hypothetical protein
MPQTSCGLLESNEMNKQTLIQLLEDGAYFDWVNQQFFHPSFRKGFRKVNKFDISWQAVERAHGIFGTNRLQQENNIYRLA